ncbi:hypothetical protein, partial [Paracoccus sp. (in: a-proteobacteria)]|uniref:hypothetical protein n=1 Tax=Paracoccus sp. TaxID=267 RepID=UPI0028A06CA1
QESPKRHFPRHPQSLDQRLESKMPKQKQWRILRDFEWVPNPRVVMTFKAGQTREGLNAACIKHAGDRIAKIKAE